MKRGKSSASRMAREEEEEEEGRERTETPGRRMTKRRTG